MIFESNIKDMNGPIFLVPSWCPMRIDKNGKVFLEIGKNHENFIIEKAIQHGLLPLEFKKDLSGVNRVIVLIIK